MNQRLHHTFPVVSRKVLRCDADRTRVCFPYLIKKTVSCSVYVLYAGDDECLSPLFVTAEDLFMAA